MGVATQVSKWSYCVYLDEEVGDMAYGLVLRVDALELGHPSRCCIPRTGLYPQSEVDALVLFRRVAHLCCNVGIQVQLLR